MEHRRGCAGCLLLRQTQLAVGRVPQVSPQPPPEIVAGQARLGWLPGRVPVPMGQLARYGRFDLVPAGPRPRPDRVHGRIVDRLRRRPDASHLSHTNPFSAVDHGKRTGSMFHGAGPKRLDVPSSRCWRACVRLCACKSGLVRPLSVPHSLQPPQSRRPRKPTTPVQHRGGPALCPIGEMCNLSRSLLSIRLATRDATHPEAPATRTRGTRDTAPRHLRHGPDAPATCPRALRSATSYPAGAARYCLRAGPGEAAEVCRVRFEDECFPRRL